MSKERFDWLREIGTDEIIATPGCESNVKEIYDRCWELKAERGDSIVIFNQFQEFGNAIWHYHTTGSVLEEIGAKVMNPGDRFAGFVSATGSAGTIAAGDYLKSRFRGSIVVAAEALQCPTLLRCGFGGHRIEGIGDKHVPWIHNVGNTDMVCAVDDEQCMALMRLFNEDEGLAFLRREGIPDAIACQLPLLGISSICNLVAAIKAASYYEMGSRDLLFIPLTDSMELYASRIAEQRKSRGDYSAEMAGRHFGRYLEGIGTDNMRELGYQERKALHNLKYFTWVEQQGRTVEELRELWEPNFWVETYALVDEWDRRIREFNERTGLLAKI
jgi:cysteine synthase